MPLSDIVTVNITTNTVATPVAGFGVPLILSTSAAWTERTRSYTTLAGVASDFATSTVEYAQASALFAQNPPPAKIMIGRLANKPTVQWSVTPIVANNTTYVMSFNGSTISYTSDGTATMAEIIAGLKAGIDALSLGVTVSDQTTYMKILCNSPGAWFQASVSDVTKLGIRMDHADPGAAADLTAIAQEDSSWYFIISAFNSQAMGAAIAGWAESNEKFFVAASQDSNTITLASGSDTGGNLTLAMSLKNSSRARSAVIYHGDNSSHMAAAWVGSRCTTDPGSENWAFAQPSGPTPSTLTATHLANLAAKNCNYFYTVGSKNIVMQGWCADAERIDVIRGRDWLKSEMQSGTFDVLSGSTKVPYTDAGIARIEGVVRAKIAKAIDRGFLAASPAPVITVPAAANVSSADKSSRTLNNVNWSATIAGAINLVTISGTVSL